MDMGNKNKNRYGQFKNVYLTAEEYVLVLKNHWEDRLESMSEWKYRRGMVELPKKTDFERLKKWN